MQKHLATLSIAGLALTPGLVFAQQNQTAEPSMETRLAAIEKAIEDGRTALHIPGLSFVIVKDDKVIYSKGFGLRDVERSLPVDSNTLFSIGSSTKAFHCDDGDDERRGEKTLAFRFTLTNISLISNSETRTPTNR